MLTSQEAISLLTSLDNHFDGQFGTEITGVIECIEGLQAEIKEQEKFYQDVNVGLCKEHFEIIKQQQAEIEGLQKKVAEAQK